MNIDSLSLVLVPIREFWHAPLIPKMLWIKEHTLTPSSVVFIFKFTSESFKEFGGASRVLTNMRCCRLKVDNFDKLVMIMMNWSIDVGKTTHKEGNPLMNLRNNKKSLMKMIPYWMQSLIQHWWTRMMDIELWWTFQFKVLGDDIYFFILD
jgi:hypothetical protein